MFASFHIAYFKKDHQIKFVNKNSTQTQLEVGVSPPSLKTITRKVIAEAILAKYKEGNLFEISDFGIISINPELALYRFSKSYLLSL